MRIVVLFLVVLAMASCGKRADDGESIVILLNRRDSDDVGVFTLTSKGWTLANRSRASEVTTELRKGNMGGGALSYTRTHVEKAIASINRSEPGDAYRVVVRVRTPGGEVRELQASGETTAVFDAVLSESGPLGPLWLEANGIPKVYWYRDVGPVDEAHREVR